MDDKLADVLLKIGEAYKSQILPDSRYYLEVDIGEQAAKYGYCEHEKKYHATYAIVPLKRPVELSACVVVQLSVSLQSIARLSIKNSDGAICCNPGIAPRK